MYLKRLEIYGFKTFAQRTVFEFPPGVTAVVGPNGSGKSNVADALRWVLGEQSFANLRSKRTDDLIFGGGKGRAPMGFAEVYLTIDNSDRLLPLPYDEVTIGRRAYRNGENEYTLNRARVRLRDVADAVAPLGSSYTLINQGLVDSALALQPEDRRRLFEDAAEIGPYQAKKQEAERRLRETEANLVRLNDLVGEFEPQLRTLKRQARDAEAVGALEADLQGLLRHFYAAQWAALGERLRAAEEDEARAAQELGATSHAREQAAEQLLSDRDRLRERRLAVEQQRQVEAELRRRLDAVLLELAVAVERVAGFERRRGDLQRRDDDLRGALEVAEAQTQQLSDQARETRARLNTQAETLAKAEAAAARISAERRAAEAALASRREALIRASARVDAERSRQAELERRLAAVADARAKLGDTLAQGRTRSEELGTTAAAAQAAVVAAEAAITAANEVVDELRAALEQARKDRERCDEQITAAQREQNELQARHDALARLARSYEGTFAGVRAAMQWAERERLGFALVSSLLRVPPELETAIEVALGTRLQQIVVAKWTDAEAAIVQLKRTGAGRATFLPLDTLKPSRRLPAPSIPGLRGVAAELVAVDERYASIRSYLLGRTLIADDLQAARLVLSELEGGWTIVTLSGEQIATGGAVSGGAATKESGTLRRERELRELPERLAAAREVVEHHQAMRAALHQRIDTLVHESRQAETRLREARSSRDAAQREAEARRREYHRAEDELAALRRRDTDFEREQAMLAERGEQVRAAIGEAVAAQAAVRSEVESAQAVVGAQAAVAGTDETALRELRGIVSRLEADVRTIAAEMRTQQQAAQRAVSERAVVAQQLHRLGQEQEQLTQQVAAWERERHVLEEELAQQGEALRAAHDALIAEERALEQLEARERALTEQTLSAEARHAEAAVTLQRYRSERDGLWERAAEDNIDVEALSAAPGAGDAEPGGERLTPDMLLQRIEQLRGRLQRMGPVNALAPQEYQAAQERHAFLTEQLADVRAAAAALRTAIGQLDQVMREHFETIFSAVAREFSRTFTQLFGGGTARLVLLESENGDDPHGIDIIAQPPGKRQLNLQLLSGGERALTAAALLFAILTVNPSPFCMLDEVDAALDEANVVRFREALLQLAQQTQFILITHNRGTVEAADTLYGITMALDGSSRTLSLRLQELDETLHLNT